MTSPPDVPLTTWRSRLLGAPMPSPLWGWGIPLLMGLIAAVLRFPTLGKIHQLIFDETYYVKQGYTLLREGYEKRWPEKPDAMFTNGQPDVYLETADFPVHPPVGKWMIAIGEWMFGIESAFGWRFAAAVCGVLMVVMTARIATRLFRSPVIGGIAGLLLAIDGHHIVHSRTSLLDIFIAFWALAAFGALVADRDDFRARLAKALAKGKSANTIIWFRPWRFVFALSLGLAIGTKWSGIYFAIVFCLLTVLWDFGARKTAGSTKPFLMGFWRDGVIAFFMLVPLTIVTYIASWYGWIVSDDAHGRTWAELNPDEAVVPGWLGSLWKYHEDMYEFHVNLSSEHTYQANPWAWVIQWRPTSFFYESPEASACGADKCSHAILSVGNVAIWWAGGLAIFAALYFWLIERDWRAGAAISGVIGGYFPWFLYQGRTIYAFYSVAFEAFLIIALAYCLARIMGRAEQSATRRRIGLAVVGTYLVVAVAISWFFYPIWAGEIITYDAWRARMWFSSWI